ncbi:uncharacterized protein PV09_00635 [Verruconis gallopava]|uniref:Uncharacterized protein n=1 Tax=Verruconis gallopava TaxID=253628 RepID=A0A0D2AQ98_9PEZI|nr:uncharacterized protein PV09_00635 [Verruconis gallopava]KIW08685.1 hypothetical protein PV09_00635 [Verruconis gallopava]
MASEQYKIISLFQTSGAAGTVKRKDSGASDAIAQLNDFKGFGTKSSNSTPPLQPVTLTFTPSVGSTCVSLYPRTKTFTYSSEIDESNCIAKCENGETWRISAVPSSPDSETPRFTFERMDGDKDAVKESFRRCSVAIPPASTSPRRQSSGEYGRRLSVGHYSSGLSGFKLPYMTKT